MNRELKRRRKPMFCQAFSDHLRDEAVAYQVEAEQRVQDLARTVSTGRGHKTHFTPFVCGLCGHVFGEYAGRLKRCGAAYLSHVRGHVEHKRNSKTPHWSAYVTHGVKSARQVMYPNRARHMKAFWRFDEIFGTTHRNYLKRTAPTDDTNRSESHRDTLRRVLITADDGPVMIQITPDFADRYREVGKRSDGLYNMTFANRFARAMFTSGFRMDSSIRTVTQPWLIGRKPGFFLLHATGNVTRMIQRDIISSKQWEEKLMVYTELLAQSGEYRILTVDVTFKTAMKCIDRNSSNTGVLTVVGATRTLLMAKIIERENMDNVIDALRDGIPARAKGQVQFLCLDKLDAHDMQQKLTLVFPNLQGLSIDPLHLCIRFDRGDYGAKRLLRTGGAALRYVMGRLCIQPREIKTPLFHMSHTPPPLTSDEQKWVDQIAKSRESPLSTDWIEQECDDDQWDQPYESREHFIKTLACFCSFYRGFMSRLVKGGSDGQDVMSCMLNAVTPRRLEYYFNNMRMRTWLTPIQALAAPVGTTSNEQRHTVFKSTWNFVTLVTIPCMERLLLIFVVGEMGVKARVVSTVVDLTHQQKLQFFQVASFCSRTRRGATF